MFFTELTDMDCYHLDSYHETDADILYGSDYDALFTENLVVDTLQPTSLPGWSLEKFINEWSSNDVYNFAKQVSYPYGATSAQIDRFKYIHGNTFTTLSVESCEKLCYSKEIGLVIYTAKEDVKQQKSINILESPTDNHFHRSLSNYSEDSLLPITYNTPPPSISSNHSDSVDSVENFRPRRPGRPRSVNMKKTVKRSEKLWEFLIHLLSDTKTCPDLIRWEDFQEGTFKFVKSEKVAKLWGNRKKNENMTYEKFSRAMRYYYKSKVLVSVPGKRLVYKFGPCAKGWNNCRLPGNIFAN